jgi:hypothetical protein
MRKFVSPRSGVRRIARVAIFSLMILSPAIAGLAVTGLAMTGLVASAIVAPTLPARAESKIFFVENQPDGYGIDQCLASGAKCGKPMARAYCQLREYGEAVSYRKAEPEEMPKASGDTAACTASGCIDFVAIECQR